MKLNKQNHLFLSLSQVSALFVTIVFICACASPVTKEEGSETQVVGGQPIKEGEFPGLLEIVSMSCTGAKIGPRHILTARHCAKQSAVGDKLSIRTGVKDEPSRYREAEISKLMPHRLAGVPNSEQDKLNIDLVVFEVKDGLDGISTAPLQKTALQDGQTVIALGYGCTLRQSVSFPVGAEFAAGGAEFTNHDAITDRQTPMKLSCKVEISDSRLTGTNAMCSFGPATVLRSAEATPGLCPGDSGGPLYVNSGTLTRPNYQLVGVNSNFHVAGESRFARIDPGVAVVNEWVLSHLTRF